ncbi:hypothetical protein HWB76_gp141 [Streptomyces phage Blueeyedbeauty]|uniref:Uncharacterized protein n=1 Tax=Streptomyces phage Blueeyedbeauty TaxID=2250336 RepID=A0A345L1V9_9CAUD|nr:hypothetical protein HWB76_gp141 [Streptomyces phage Blueeyedbeauty]AXH49261.1 hypothetical protein SEA_BLUEEYEDBEAUTY_142 [Streptomyces phage Blueeyedbeauty]
MDWQVKVFLICIAISVVCKIGTILLSSTETEEPEVVVPMNRQQRRHPNGKVPAQRFQRVSAKGRQKQGNNRAIKGW